LRFYNTNKGGKTSSVSILSDLFESLGWRVYRVPETATILFGAGVSFPDLDDKAAYSFQKSILNCMLNIEDAYRKLAILNAERGIKTAIICDRGAMDPSAYMDREGWLRMLGEMGLEEVSLRDHRYDCIIHMVTAAKGAESFYTLETNATRTEGLELAAKLDTAVMNAWVGKPIFTQDTHRCR
jgi:AAA domain